MRERGVTEEELSLTLERGEPAPARYGRSAKAMVFNYNALWRGRSYSQKRVEAVFVVEGEDTVVITVYGYYGRWSS